jgi:hypothetical protein
MFNVARQALFDGTLDLDASTFSVTPVEGTPATTDATYGAIANKSTTGGGNPLVQVLADVGGSPANRVLDVPAESKVIIQFAPVDYLALSTDTSAPINGWVVANAASPIAGTLPVFYIENVDTGGSPAPFTPNGIDDLTLDLQTYPIGVSEYGFGFTNSYLVSRLKGEVAAMPTVSFVLLESAHNPATMSTFADLSAITAKTPGGDPIYVELSEFEGDIANRITQSGDNFYWRFNNPRFTELATLSSNPITHYALIAAGGVLTGTELVIGGDTISPALTPDGVKSFIVRISSGILVGI